MNIAKTVGMRIKHLRDQIGETQDDIAKLLGTSRPTVTRYENGKREPDFNTIVKLARHFNVSVDYLLGLTDIPVPMPPAADPITLNDVFAPESIDSIRCSMTYKGLSHDISEKMDNPLYKDILTADYLKKLASGKIQASHEIVGILADYAGVDSSFFYKSNTPEVPEEDCAETAAHGESGSVLDDKLKAFISDAENVEYIKFAMSLKGLNMGHEKLSHLNKSLLKNRK